MLQNLESISGVSSDERPHLDSLSPLTWFIAYFSWPALVAISIFITAIGFEQNRVLSSFLFTYVLLMLSLLGLEHLAPFENDWHLSDGQIWNDIGHTLINKGVAEALAVIAAAVKLESLVPAIKWHGTSIWPTHWPVAVQVMFALTLVEFFLYWAHRLAHEHPFLWRFHALHHSVLRLWVVNTGKFHFVESAIKVIGLTFFMLFLGMPMIIVYWVSVMTAYIGIFTHCNVEMRTNWISWIFNTPNLHRWHHSPRLDEGNTNYGETVMLWDLLFKSFYQPPGRPGTDIGLNSGRMPESFWAQLKWPFLKNSV